MNNLIFFNFNSFLKTVQIYLKIIKGKAHYQLFAEFKQKGLFAIEFRFFNHDSNYFQQFSFENHSCVPFEQNKLMKPFMHGTKQIFFGSNKQGVRNRTSKQVFTHLCRKHNSI